MELDPQPNDAKPVRTLNDYELASRLSYFLWSSMPDDELFDLAGRGKLRENLDGQVRRMLARSEVRRPWSRTSPASGCNCATSTLAAPDKKQFPAFDDDLRRAMRTETEMFFATVLREDRSVLELLDADYTFVNERLARHYGLRASRGTSSAACRSGRRSRRRARPAAACSRRPRC